MFCVGWRFCVVWCICVISDGGFCKTGGDFVVVILCVRDLIYLCTSSNSIYRISMAVSLSNGSWVGIVCACSNSMSGWVRCGSATLLLIITSLPFFVGYI